MTMATRTALLALAIAEDRLLIAFHLAGRGYAERADGTYRRRRVGAGATSRITTGRPGPVTGEHRECVFIAASGLVRFPDTGPLG